MPSCFFKNQKCISEGPFEQHLRRSARPPCITEHGALPVAPDATGPLALSIHRFSILEYSLPYTKAKLYSKTHMEFSEYTDLEMKKVERCSISGCSMASTHENLTDKDTFASQCGLVLWEMPISMWGFTHLVWALDSMANSHS